jgi:Transposase DDE domain
MANGSFCIFTRAFGSPLRSGSFARVKVMQAADFWNLHHVTEREGLQHARYGISQKKRKRIEECFGWLKTIALLRKVRHRGTLTVDWMFTFACAAYNLVRMRNLMAATVPAQ